MISLLAALSLLLGDYGPLPTTVKVVGGPVSIYGTVAIANIDGGAFAVNNGDGGPLNVSITNTDPIYVTLGDGGAGSASVSISQPLAVTVVDGGPLPVTGTFWQTTQPISGAVTVSNLPVTQPVSGTVAVTGAYQATQPVSGTFWQSTQPVSGTFWQATQPVSGTVAVTGAYQATQPVSGTFWQATQPVSGTVTSTIAQPLAVTVVDGGQIDVKVTNSVPVTGTFWQTTQPVSGTVTASNTITTPVFTQAGFYPTPWNCNVASATASTQCQVGASSGYLYIKSAVVSNGPTAQNIKITDGTGTNCANSLTVLAGPYYLAVNGPVSIPFDPPLKVANPDAGVCCTISGSTAYSCTLNGFQN